MQLIEKRSNNRSNSNDSHDEALIEIKHSFGARKRSAYQIQEHNEKGLSFLVPKDMVKLSEAIPAETKFNLKEIENGICKFIEIEC